MRRSKAPYSTSIRWYEIRQSGFRRRRCPVISSARSCTAMWTSAGSTPARSTVTRSSSGSSVRTTSMRGRKPRRGTVKRGPCQSSLNTSSSSECRRSMSSGEEMGTGYRAGSARSSIWTVKGVVLAGGTGSRLDPLTRITNKHLLPIYDRPMIEYAIEALVGAGVEEIMIVTGGTHAGEFLRLFGNGHGHGIETLVFSYQEQPGGIAQA